MQDAPKKPERKQTQESLPLTEEEEERRKYRDIDEDKLNRIFLREMRWLAKDVVPDNIYDRGLRANFAEILHPISERKMDAAWRVNKHK